MMEFTTLQLDTVKTTQQEILEKLDKLSEQVEEERDERVRTQAVSTATMNELREAVEVLTYRISDTEQLLSGERRTPTRPIYREKNLADSLLVEPDSTLLGPPSDGDDDSVKLYKSSYMDLTIGSYDLAVQGFKNFLVRYPASPHVASAHYYLGEAYYSLERYLEAVSEYQSVIREYPNTRLLPAAYLKSGYCYQKLEEQQLAEKAFRELIARFPRSEEAEQARVALQGQEG